MNPLDLNKDFEFEKVTPNDSDSIINDSIVENSDAKSTTSSNMNYNNCTLEELYNLLTTILIKEVSEIRDEVEIIKQVFYKKRKIEVDEQKKAFLESGEDENSFIPSSSEIEEKFKTLLNEYRVKKASFTAHLEKEKENNLLKKQELLNQMKSLAEQNDGDASTHIPEFKTLQVKWKQIGQVPQSAVIELWKQYNLYQEAFWDLVKINNEMREYDFKKNLELKTSICEQAENLNEENDVIIAFQKLQLLHEKWHDIGPVNRELRESLWSRFKEATSSINKKHQAYFDTIRKSEEENLTLKNNLCEKIETFDLKEICTYKEWDEATKKMLEWQAEWKSIGFAPRKVNQKIFERYRSACDKFFEAKSEFYKQSKNELNLNAEKKKSLCEQAELLKESTNWKETSELLTQLQKEWKTIGPVSKKQSDELWSRFIGACDYFFQQKNKNISNSKSIEHDNLAKKIDLIEKINAFVQMDNYQNSLQALKELTNQWNEIGHVPFKEKDKLYKEYKTALDKQFELLNATTNNSTEKKRVNNSSNKSNSHQEGRKKENKGSSERDKLYRQYESLKSEIATYENNIGFFSSSTKKGGGLIKEMEDKINALKLECKQIEKKIIEIDEN
jgi:isopenicillin N synthase-like dioxygenase